MEHTLLGLSFPMYQDRPSSHRIAPHDASFLPKKGGNPSAPSGTDTLLRLNPNHLPYLRPQQVQTSGIGDFHGLTGGVYKTRERIHGSVLTYRY